MLAPTGTSGAPPQSTMNVHSTNNNNPSNALGSGSSEDAGEGVALSLVCAIAAPLVMSLVNLFDKVAVEKRVWNTYSFTAVVGIFEMLIGGVECALVGWDNLSGSKSTVVVWPVVGGVIDGASNYLYFLLIGLTDASIVVGIQYIYPAVVSVLSFIFLHEKLTAVGYVGMVVVLASAVLLSVNGLSKLVRCCFPHARILEGMDHIEKAEEPVVPRDKPVSCWCPTPRRLRRHLHRCCRSKPRTTEEHRVPLTPRYGACPLPQDKSVTPEPPTSPSHTPPPPPQDHEDHEDHHQQEQGTKRRGNTGSDNSTADSEIIQVEDLVVADAAGAKSGSRPQTTPAEAKKSRSSKCVPPQVLFAVLAAVMVLSMGTHEFLMAFGTKNGMKELQVSGVETMVQGFTLVLVALVVPDARRCFLHELAWNWFFAFVHSLLGVCAQLLTVRSLVTLPAAVSFSLCAVQPLGVLLLETVTRVSVFRVNQCLAFKLPTIALTVAGVILLSFSVVEDDDTHTTSSSSSASSIFV